MVTTPMPGQVTLVAVSEGERAGGGQRLLAVEAMKMKRATPRRSWARWKC
jgi:biotin carboxyl carrier protein